MKKTDHLWKYEKYFFLLFIIISLLPIFSSKFFPTTDGPAHLHNGNLLSHIWFGGNTDLLQFFDKNSNLNSNWINHVWIAIGGLFLPPYLVEKSILVFYIVSLPLSFRFLVKSITDSSRSSKISSYLIFPFIYSFPFCIGFFNFCIGIPLLFWTLGLWIKYRNNESVAVTLLLTGLCTLVYLGHVFNFLLLEIVLFAVVLMDIIKNKDFKTLFRQLIRLLIISFPGLLLLLLFMLNNNTFEHDPPRYLSTEKLISTITSLGPLITLNLENELPFTLTIFYTICVLVLLVIINNIRKRKEKQGRTNLFWLAVALFVLVLYFVFPDWLSSGGFISIRWALFFFMMILVWIASAELPPYQLILPAATILVTHVFFMSYHNEETKLLNADAIEVAGAEEHMEAGAVLLPLNYSTNWVHINYACYAATKKAIVVLDNYEPTKPHFPLIWKEGESVYELMEHYGDRNPPCINIANYETKTKHRIDYVSRWCFNGDLSDSCANNTELVLTEQFELIYESPRKRLQLFKRKNEN